MKAMQYLRYGSPDQLQLREVPEPRPSRDQLLVKVRAASVNPVDWKLRDGSLRFIAPVRFPSTPGLDLTGSVVATGENVARFRPGDRVFACLSSRSSGSAVELCLVDESLAARVPEGLSDREAAAIPLAGMTALQALRDLGELKPGQRVLINGASGGVGHYAVQIAKNLGADVTAVCGTDNLDWVRELGADRVIDYTRESPVGAGLRFDLVFDCVTALAGRDIDRLLTPAGIYVATLPRPDLLLRGLVARLGSRQRFKIVLLKSDHRDLETLAEQAAGGRLRTRIDQVYPLEQLAEAHRRSQTGRVKGKLVFEVA